MILRKSLPCLVLITFCFLPLVLQAQNIPSGYQLLYEQHFRNQSGLKDFEMTDASAWRLGKGKGGMALELHGKSEYSPPARSPHNIAIIKDQQFGSFILEAELQQTGKEYGHRDLCLFFGMEDPAHFYYVHMASKADPHAHNIFLVNEAPRTAIATKTTEGINWGETDQWHKIRLERNLDSGTIKVFFDDMSTPIMEAKDQHFEYGHIGFGSFDDTGKFDNIKVWATEAHPAQDPFFKSK